MSLNLNLFGPTPSGSLVGGNYNLLGSGVNANWDYFPLNLDTGYEPPPTPPTPPTPLPALTPAPTPTPPPVAAPTPNPVNLPDYPVAMDDPRNPVYNDMTLPDGMADIYSNNANNIINPNDDVYMPTFEDYGNGEQVQTGFTDDMGTQIQTNVSPMVDDSLMTLEEYIEANSSLLSPQAQALNAINPYQSSQTMGDVTIQNNPQTQPSVQPEQQTGTYITNPSLQSGNTSTPAQYIPDQRQAEPSFSFWHPANNYGLGPEQMPDIPNASDYTLGEVIDNPAYQYQRDRWQQANAYYNHNQGRNTAEINNWNRTVDDWNTLQGQYLANPYEDGLYQAFGEIFEYDPITGSFNSINTDRTIYDPGSQYVPQMEAPRREDFIGDLLPTITGTHYVPPSSYDDGGA